MNAHLRRWTALCMTAGSMGLPMAAHAADLSASQPLTTSQNAMPAQPPASEAGDWRPDPPADLTRAQVEQQLEHAQQDGQISYLDRTLYAHH
jgi:hypothetical protein